MPPKPMKVLSYLILCYVMVFVFANWFDGRLIAIGSVVSDAGTIIFPITFILANVITEVYGYKHTRRAIWLGFIFNLVFVLYAQVIIHFPSPSFAQAQNHVFDQMMQINGRIFIASIISYLCCEPLNAMIMARLKIICKGKKMALRFVSSTFIAAFFDSALFSSIAFFPMFNGQASKLLLLILSMWVIKVSIEILLLPCSLYLAQKLKKVEHLDQYDYGTNFSILRWDVDYPGNNS